MNTGTKGASGPDNNGVGITGTRHVFAHVRTQIVHGGLELQLRGAARGVSDGGGYKWGRPTSRSSRKAKCTGAVEGIEILQAGRA